MPFKHSCFSVELCCKYITEDLAFHVKLQSVANKSGNSLLLAPRQMVLNAVICM